MNSIHDFDSIVPTADEMLTENFSGGDPIGMSFASGMHETDLISFLERAKHLAGEVC